MTSSGKLKHMNKMPSDVVAASTKTSTSQIDNCSATGDENQDLNHRISILEVQLNTWLNKENIQIKQLQNKIDKLQEQAIQHETQIKVLKETVMNLQRYDSKESQVESVISTDAKGNMASQSDVSIRREEEDNHLVLSSIKNLSGNTTTQIKSEIITTYKNDLGFQNQERSTIAQSGSEELHADELQLIDPKSNDRVSNTQVTPNSKMMNEERTSENKDKSEILINNNSSTTLKSTASNLNQSRPTTLSKEIHHIIKDQDERKYRESKDKHSESKDDREHSPLSSGADPTRDRKSLKSTECSDDPFQKKRSVRYGTHVFTRWMNSREDGLSLWSDENYRRPLLSYIGNIYGQKKNIYRILAPLRIEFNKSDELDQLYAVIKQFEKQPDAKESLREWRLQTRSNHRLVEIKAIFEYSSAYPSASLGDWKITRSSATNLEEILNRESVKACFDLICRDGLVTADIGEYLHLKKEDILGGTDYDSHNERVTFVKVNLSQSTIALDDNRVDLITCFVTLHHVPDIAAILLELVRILRPGGYLILREHDCKKTRSLLAKYLNFVHAFMMIAGVGEFAKGSVNHIGQKQDESDDDSENDTTSWNEQKSRIIEYTNSIQYRTRDEWNKELERVGFRHKVTLEYDLKSQNNPQALYYGVYQLDAK